MKTCSTSDVKLSYARWLGHARPSSSSVTLMSLVFCLAGILLCHIPFVIVPQHIRNDGKSCQGGNLDSTRHLKSCISKLFALMRQIIDYK